MRCLPPPPRGHIPFVLQLKPSNWGRALKLLVWDAREPGGGDSSPSS